jgi:(p)ppGpp synthase/HD superfamily hydrolase
MLTLVERARIYATAAHAGKGQRRRYTGEPYIVHPTAVVELLMQYTEPTDVEMAAGYLHDVIEDTDVLPHELAEEFGEEVVNLVLWLSDTTTPADGNRAKRQGIERDRLAGGPVSVQTIKVADLMDNTKSIVKHDPAFAKVYLQEKAELLAVLTEAHPRILAAAREQLAALTA